MRVRSVATIAVMLYAVALAPACAARVPFFSNADQSPVPPGTAPPDVVAGSEATGDALAEDPNADTASSIVPVSATLTSGTDAPVLPAAPAVALNLSPEFRIGTEDILDVQVWKNCPDLCRTVPVRPDGKISVPLVNDIQAAGLTATELRGQLTQRLSEFIPSPEVSVIVREVHSVKVSVVGAVRMPGNYEVNSAVTVLDMLARAQGLTEFANRDRIVVHRQNGNGATTRIDFNYSRVADGRDDNFFVQPGDIIVVP